MRLCNPVAWEGTLIQSMAERIYCAGNHLAEPLIQTYGNTRLSGEAIAWEVAGRLMVA